MLVIQPEETIGMKTVVSSPLHPETLRTLEQLVKLHGAVALIKAIREIELRTKRLTTKQEHNI
jgi:hypothetical protein